MPYLQPKAVSPALACSPLLCFPSSPMPSPVPPAISYTLVTGERETANVIRDTNLAAVPLTVPRSRSRGAIKFPDMPSTSPQPQFEGPHHRPSSPDASSRRFGAVRERRRRGQQPSLSIITTTPPTPDAEIKTAPLLAAAPISPPAVQGLRKHFPVQSGTGLQLNIAALKRAVSECRIASADTAEPPFACRMSESDVSSLIRKKSGDIVRPALKPFRPAGPGGVSLHIPSPSKSGATTPASPESPTETFSPRGIRKFCKSAPPTPTASKSVHFDSQLEHVKFFLAEQKPAAVSRTGSPTEDSDTSGTERGLRGLSSFPWGPHSPSSEDDRVRAALALRIVNAKPVVRDSLPAGQDVQAQSFVLTPDKRDVSIGVLVRNIAFAKVVVVRFTLDGWQTTSEVVGRHLESVWSDPSQRGRSSPDMDRFTCTVKLGDFGGRIRQKTMLAAVRYDAESQTIWDNNCGANYQIVFEAVEELEPPSPVTPQLQTLDRKLAALDRDDTARRDWGASARVSAGTIPSVARSGALNGWPTRASTIPNVHFPTAHNANNSRANNRAHQRVTVPFRDIRCSPRDLDDPSFAHAHLSISSGRGGDSDSEIDLRGPRLRKKPNSYFDITPSPGQFQTWGYMANGNGRPSIAPPRVPLLQPSPERRPPSPTALPLFSLGVHDSSTSSSDGSDIADDNALMLDSTLTTPRTSHILTPSPPSSETERLSTPIPVISHLLDERARTDSNSSISSEDSLLTPAMSLSPPMLNGSLSPMFNTDLFLGISVASTPAVSTATSTSANSPISPSSPLDEFVGRQLPEFVRTGFSSRPGVDSDQYSYMLQHFCFGGNNDSFLRLGHDERFPTYGGDYFGSPMIPSAPSMFSPQLVSKAPAMQTQPTLEPQPADASGHSTPTTPRAGTPTTEAPPTTALGLPLYASPAPLPAVLSYVTPA